MGEYWWDRQEQISLGWGYVDIPLRRRMTRTHAILWTVILTATFLDVATTIVGLEHGIPEGNPVMRTMIESFGVAGIGFIKFPALVSVASAWMVLSDRNASIALGLFGSVTSLVVVSNLIALSTVLTL